MANAPEADLGQMGERIARMNDTDGSGKVERNRSQLKSRRTFLTQAAATGAGAAALAATSGPASAAFGVMPTDEIFDWRQSMMLQQAETVNTSAARRAEYALYENPDPNAPQFDPTQSAARLIPHSAGERYIVLDNRRGDVFSGVFFRDGGFVQSSLQQINYLFRDRRNNEVRRIDPNLINILYSVLKVLDTRQTIQIISGYRSAATNAMLRQTSSRVARNSFHIVGQAADIRIAGRSPQAIRAAANSMRTGGIGIYPGSGFVHLDTGPYRNW